MSQEITGPDDFSQQDWRELYELKEQVDQTAEQTGIPRRDILKGAGLLAAGSLAGGISAQQAIERFVQEAEAQASTSDSDGNVGTPSDPVDVFADGIDATSASIEQQFINNNQIYVQPSQPPDLTDAVWLDTDAQPFSSVQTFLSSSQDISIGFSSQTLQFDNTARDKRNEWDNTNYQFVPDEDGVYHVDGRVAWQNPGTDHVLRVNLFVNGGSERRVVYVTPTNDKTSMDMPSAYLSLNAGDTVEIRVANEDFDDSSVLASTERTWLNIQRVD